MAGFAFDVAVPVRITGGVGWLYVTARLRPGQTPESPTAALRAAQPQIRAVALPAAVAAGASASRYLNLPLSATTAAALFCALVHRDKRGILAGEETGGEYYRLAAEKFTQLKLTSLPGTVVVPLRKVVLTDVADPAIPFGRGVMPDHAVSRTVGDDLDPSQDTILAYAAKLFQVKADRQ